MSNTTSYLDDNISIGCGCAACGAGDTNSINLYQNISNFGIYSGAWGLLNNEGAPTTEADPTTFANYLTSGYWEDSGGQEGSWQENILTYSFYGLNEDQKEGFRLAFDMWADVADIAFSEVAEDADPHIEVIERPDSFSAGAGSSLIGTGTDNVGEYFRSGAIFLGTANNSHADINNIGDRDFLLHCMKLVMF